MTTSVDIVNRALQAIGTRTTVSTDELTAQSSNEAIQASLVLDATRDQLTRMAPWSHSTIVDKLVYISSLPGTPENPGIYNGQWTNGLPEPPWLYMYQYPGDCLRALSIIAQPSNSGGVPIFPCVTGFDSTLQDRERIPFKIVNNVYRGTFSRGFSTAFQPNARNLTARAILCNESKPLLSYCWRETNPDVMDPEFQEAWVYVLGSKLALALTGDKSLANGLLQSANEKIIQARALNATETPTTLDHTPDWIRTRGFLGPSQRQSFSWGPLWPSV